MLRQLTLIILQGFIVQIISAQSINHDSLQLVIQTRKDSNVVKAYLQYADYYRWSKPDSGIYFAEKAIEFNNKKVNQPRFTAFAWNSIGYARYMKGEYQPAAAAFREYYRWSEKTNDKINMGFALNNEGNIYIELGDYGKALDLYKEALVVRQSANDANGIAMSYNNIGYIYKDIGDYEKAIGNFLYALREYEKLGEKKSIAQTEVYIGIVYAKKKEFAKALAYYDRAMALQKATGDNNELAITYQAVASVLTEQKEYDNAIDKLDDAMKIHSASGDVRQIALVHDDLAAIYQQKKMYDSAAWHYKQSVQQNKSIGNNRNLAASWLGLAESYLGNEQLSLSKPALDSALTLIKITSRKEDLARYYKASASYYSSSGDGMKAFEMQKNYAVVQDSLLNDQNVKAIADMEIKYETEKKEQEIIVQRAELSRKNVVLWASAILFVFSLLLGLSFYRRYRLKQQAKLQAEIMHQQELSTKAVIVAEEDERQRIARDLHDGIGQMMSAAKMNLSAIESRIIFKDEEQHDSFEKIIGLVDESCKEIRAVSHNMMPNALLKNSLASAIRDFIDKMDKKALQVHVYTEGLDERLDSNVETVFYRIIQECVNNVIKHAEASTLDISVIHDRDGISATIEDNGQGFDTSLKEKFEGIGLKNIITRIGFLKGTVDFDSSPGNGTVIAIHVPIPANI